MIAARVRGPEKVRVAQEIVISALESKLPQEPPSLNKLMLNVDNSCGNDEVASNAVLAANRHG
jgi:hypothetical protein